MDTESGSGAPEIPVEQWYPAVSAAIMPSMASPDRADAPTPTSSHPDLFDASRSDLLESPAAAPLRPVRSGLPLRVIGAAAAIAVVLGAVVTAVVLGAGGKATDDTSGGVGAAGTSSGSATGANLCGELTGDLVTDSDRNRDTPVNVVAALQYALYAEHDPEAAAALYAPNAVDKAKLASDLAGFPPGTKHCVAASQTGPNQVNMQVRLVLPDGSPPILYKSTVMVTPSAPYAIVFLQNVGQ